jgi:potassium-transporting ATPase KdpC subunit
MLKQLKPALILFALMSILTGLIYPGAVTLLAQVIFPAQANGSLIRAQGNLAGSSLIGQNFDDSKYFWGRLSGTGGFPDNAAASSGTNLGVVNPNLAAQVTARLEALRAADPGNTQSVPVDLVTASASGLDPHISPATAAYQAARVARERGISLEQVNTLIAQNTQGPDFGFLGEARVNVLQLNLALDGLQ